MYPKHEWTHGVGALVLLALALSQASVAQLVLYDNFSERFLDPSRWIPNSTCSTFSTLECVREIQHDGLRLTVRNYGATNSNQGSQFGLSELHFTNPASIRAIATRLAVRHVSASDCPANPGAPSHAHALITGRFFNSGTGAAGDDVQAFLTFDHFTYDPEGMLEAEAFISWQGQFFGFVSLGTVNIKQAIIAQLRWDQPSHRFVASWTDGVTGNVNKVFLPYAMADTTPPSVTDKFSA